MGNIKSTSEIRYKSRKVRGGTSEGSRYRAKRLRDAAEKGEVPTTKGHVKIGKNPSVKKEIAKEVAKEVAGAAIGGAVAKGGQLAVKVARVAYKGGKAALTAKRAKRAADAARKASARSERLNKPVRDKITETRKSALSKYDKQDYKAANRRLKTADRLKEDAVRKPKTRSIERLEAREIRAANKGKKMYEPPASIGRVKGFSKDDSAKAMLDISESRLKSALKRHPRKAMTSENTMSKAGFKKAMGKKKYEAPKVVKTVKRKANKRKGERVNQHG